MQKKKKNENPKYIYAFILHVFPKIKRSSISLDLASIGSFNKFLGYPFEFPNLDLKSFLIQIN